MKSIVDNVRVCIVMKRVVSLNLLRHKIDTGDYSWCPFKEIVLMARIGGIGDINNRIFYRCIHESDEL